MVDTRGGKSTTPYMEEQEERVAAILKERKEKEAKKQALLEEQATKKKLEKEMERLNREEDEKLKKVEEEEEEGEEIPLVRSVRREERGESSGISEEEKKLEKVSEWVANVSLGENEEALMYIPQDEREVVVAKIQALTDPLQWQALEEEKRMEWKLRLRSQRRSHGDKVREGIGCHSRAAYHALAQGDL
ncbi:hypothetical protein CBR_g22859 [Chara braunii]|uniref:Uncharacterized protein n=1 Tax=Chara braunii TaxID=69332 RepID=A0A388L365_CHABU|nr:hypothetical protein CBR_g22859 [Chara braunii]|eukprot:GBG76643.1 hypothetical protein CBR_g22859 [Chara braunii]